jgi:hypothetical protein
MQELPLDIPKILDLAGFWNFGWKFWNCATRKIFRKNCGNFP